jgi:hypothetical protein
MDASQVQQIAEAIKTLNLNVDSKTLENVVNQLKPLLWWKFIILPLVDELIFILFIGIIAFAIWKIFTHKEHTDD